MRSRFQTCVPTLAFGTDNLGVEIPFFEKMVFLPLPFLSVLKIYVVVQMRCRNCWGNLLWLSLLIFRRVGKCFFAHLCLRWWARKISYPPTRTNTNGIDVQINTHVKPVRYSRTERFLEVIYLNIYMILLG